MITARLFVYTLVSVGGQHTEVSTFCAPCKSSSPIGCLLHSCIWTWIQLPANTHVRYTARIIHATQIITTPHFTRPSFFLLSVSVPLLRAFTSVQLGPWRRRKFPQMSRPCSPQAPLRAPPQIYASYITTMFTMLNLARQSLLAA